MPVPTPLRVAVLSPYELMRAGLTLLVEREPDRAQVVDVSTHDGHLAHVDVALYDLAALGAGGAADLEHLLASGVPVVGLARESRDDWSQGAASLGVTTLVQESTSARELAAVLERAAGRRPPSHRDHSPHPDHLSDREIEVMRLICLGVSNAEIADRLFLSINSIKTYIRSAYRKAGVRTRPQAVLWGVQHGLVQRHPRDLEEGGATA